ncbi:MAG: hypothetical protein ACRBK7_00935 [Acidimicrobiales bacterium]
MTVLEQDRAAESVMAQLEASEQDLSLAEIRDIDGLGPMPWTSLTGQRSQKALRAWRAIAAQLPARDLVSADQVAADMIASDLTFAESEAPDETGGNDTADTGDVIEGFGTGEGEESMVTITGNLSGAEVRPPIEGDCESAEDDGSIDLANFTPAAEFQVALCVGEIGDGPFGETSGDTDFYSYGEVAEGTLLILDVANVSGSLDPVSSVIGIYDADGTLLGSIEDSGEGEGDTFLEVIAPSAGVYYGAVVGCCELQGDPFESSSGAGADETGTYEVFVVAFPPPCGSEEDDGSLALANSTNVAEQGGDFCTGVMGDGPHEAADGDFYALGFVEADQQIVADVVIFEGELFRSVLGIYDAEGNLLASGEDSGNPEEGEFVEFITESPGEYFVAVAGCCELPSDPTDPASGTPSDQGGLYEIFVGAFEPPCTSAEDDGSLGLANETNAALGGDFCEGVIGDGPHGAADGDFYALGTIGAGSEIVADVVVFEEPVRTVVGVYNSSGELIASAEDSGDPEIDEFLVVPVEVEDDYFVAVAGCCELPTDPTDPASGSASEEAGNYAVFVAAQAPPCQSREEDGSIGDANDASNVFGDEDLFETTCDGFVGDGPQAELNGDVDFFRTRVLPADRLLIVDLFDPFLETPDAGDLTIGVYNEAGDLIGSGQDDPSESGPASNFFSVLIPAEGSHYISFGGSLPTDATDPTTGTNTDITSGYFTFVVDTTEEFLEGDAAQWGLSVQGAAVQAEAERFSRGESPQAALFAKLADARTSVSAAEQEPVVDIDFFLVELRKGDAIAGGFDASRITGILDPGGVQRSGSQFNPSFIYPPASPLAHPRRNGFDHVATVDGVHAVFVGEGVGAYEGELRVVRSGLGTTETDDQQIIFLDFDGAEVSGDVFGTGVDATLSPLSAFLANWGLTPADEDAVIDSTIDAVVETLDTDLRVLDGRNGDRDASGTPGEFDVEVLNSRDHGDRWGEPNVTRVVVGGTINELQIPTLGIAQSIDPGNTESEETAVVLLDEMSGPVGSEVSINTYGLADGVTKSEFVGFVVGHITGHEIGHLIGNWHQDTFNEVIAIMDAGGDFPAIAGVGPDGIFGTADDNDPDFIEDEFHPFEGFVGIEDTAGRTAFGLSTGLGGPVVEGPSNLTIELDGVAYPGEQVDVYGQFDGGVAPFSVEINWGDGSTCPDDGTCFVDPMEDDMPNLVDADYTYAEPGVYTVEVTVTDANGNSVSASVDTAACTIIGTNRAETLNGTEGDDVICGLGGNDRLFGRGGNDIMFGGSGRDRMNGGAGNDTMLGGSEADDMTGGDGIDTMSGGKGNDVMRGGDDADVMNGRLGGDRMFGEAGADNMSGNRGNDRMYGGVDGDTMSGGRGSDQVHGQGGDDVAAGGQGRDIVTGANGNDMLSGGTGADNLSGGAGNDDLDGGADNDRCVGGAGANTLVSCES